MAESCSLFGRCREHQTGKQTNKRSELYDDLLLIRENNPSFSRKQANDLFALSQSKKFWLRYKSDMVLTSKDIDAEPALAPFFEKAKSMTPNVTYEDVRKVLDDKYSLSGSYEKIVEAVYDFNVKGLGGKLFMATLEYSSLGGYTMRIVLNNPSEQTNLLNMIAAANHANMIAEQLRSIGVDFIIGDQTKYSTKNPQKTTMGLYGLIQLKEGNYNVLDVCMETGHFIVDALGRTNPLIRKLFSAIEQHWNVVGEVLGDEEAEYLAKIENNNLEAVGHFVGKFLEKEISNKGPKTAWQKVKSSLKHIGNIIKRMIDYLGTKIPLGNQEYRKASYEAKLAAYKIVKSFLRGKFTGTIDNALSTNHELSSSNTQDHVMLKSAKEIAREFIKAVAPIRNLEDSDYDFYKDKIRTVKDKINKIASHKIVIGDTSDELIDSFTDFMVELFKDLDTAILVHASLLFQVIEGKDFNGNPISITKAATAIKLFEALHNFIANTLPKLNKDYIDKLSFASQSGQGQTKKAEIETAVGKVANALDVALTKWKNSSSGKSIDSWTHLLNVARRRCSLQLLTLINGSEFIGIEHHVMISSEKEIKGILGVNNSTLDLAEELNKSSMSLTVTWWSRWIDAMADSPDILNQLVANVVEEKNYIADLKTEEVKRKILEWNDKCRKEGIKDSEIFFEKSISRKKGTLGKKGKIEYSGNLVSERQWGNWENRYSDDKASFRRLYYLDHKGQFKNKQDMLYDLDFIEAEGKWESLWHAQNSSYVVLEDLDGNPVKNDDGEEIAYYVPALETDTDLNEKNASSLRAANGITKKNYYSSPQWNTMKPSHLKLLLEYIHLKRELDLLLPNGSVNRSGVRAPQFAGTLTDRGLGGSIHSITYLVAQSPNDTEFGGLNDTYEDEDVYDFMSLDEYTDKRKTALFNPLLNNYINNLNRVPVYGVRKLKRKGDISRDLVHSTIAYAHMAHKNRQLREVVGALEVLKDLYVNGRLNNRNGEVMGAEDSMTRRFGDYMRQQVYNKYYSETKNRDPLARMAQKSLLSLTKLGSYTYLGWNLNSAIVNAGTGMIEIAKEAGRGLFNKRDVAWAEGTYLKYWGGAVALNAFNLTQGNRALEATNKMYQLIHKFDFLNENTRRFQEFTLQTYGSQLRKGGYWGLSMKPFSITEAWMTVIPALAMMHHTKVRNKNTGEIINLWDLYKAKGGKLLVRGNNKKEWLEETADFKPEELWEIKDESLNILNSLLGEEIAESTGKILTDAERERRELAVYVENPDYDPSKLPIGIAPNYLKYFQRINIKTAGGKELEAYIKINTDQVPPKRTVWIKDPNTDELRQLFLKDGDDYYEVKSSEGDKPSISITANNAIVSDSENLVWKDYKGEYQLLEAPLDGVINAVPVKSDNGANDLFYMKSQYRTWNYHELNLFRLRVKGVNDRMHGVYNKLDLGAYGATLVGGAIASLKKYAIGLIDRRFSRGRFDYRTKTWRQGSWTTEALLLRDLFASRDVGKHKYSNNLNKAQWGLKNAKEKFGNKGAFRNFINGFGIPLVKDIRAILEFALTNAGYFIKLDSIYRAFGRKSPMHKMMESRGYSTELIYNMARANSDAWAMILLNLLMRLVFAPPKKEDKEAWWYSWARSVFSMYTGMLGLSKIVSDNTWLDPVYAGGEDYEFLWNDYENTPFLILGMFYYFCKRWLLELGAFNALSPGYILREYNTLTSNSVTGFSAFVDLCVAGYYLCNGHHYSDGEIETAEQNNVRHIELSRKASMYIKGPYKWLYKGSKKVWGLYTPFKNFFIAWDAYESAKNLTKTNTYSASGVSAIKPSVEKDKDKDLSFMDDIYDWAEDKLPFSLEFTNWLFGYN